jgi:hypothetical protein
MRCCSVALTITLLDNERALRFLGVGNARASALGSASAVLERGESLEQGQRL